MLQENAKVLYKLFWGFSPLNSALRQRVKSVQATSGHLCKVEMMLIGTILTLPWEL